MPPHTLRHSGALEHQRNPPSRRPRPLRLLAGAVGLCVAATLALGACGNTDTDGLTGDAAAGRDIARDRGCTQCHSADGGDNARWPSWAGLAGSEVTLEDGSTVTADREYLERAITDPASEIVEGYKPIMPKVPLDDAQLDQVIAYIEALGDGASTKD